MRGASHVHVLDEPDLGAVAAAELDQSHELVVIGAADDDGVELEAGEERRGGADAGEHAIELVQAGELLKPIAVQRIQADRQAMKARVLQRLRVVGQEHAVGRHGEIADARTRRQPRHQVGHVAAEQRLAAGEPHLVHAQIEEHVHEPLDLLEVQDVLARQPHVVLLRHAVAAPEVAPVGDRQPEVAERALELVEEHCAHCSGT